jgi:hypothetical protein
VLLEELDPRRVRGGGGRDEHEQRAGTRKATEGTGRGYHGGRGGRGGEQRR